MKRFWKRESDLEGALRAFRSEPRREFEDGLVDRLIAAGSRTTRRSGVRVGALVALTATMLALVGAFGGFSYAANAVNELSSAQAVYNKVLVCHKGHEINVDENAVPAFLSQGDTLGACPAAFAPPVIGTGGSDTLNAGNGAKKVSGGGGDDVIKGGNGNQRLSGGDGNDTITAGKKGHAVIYGGSGDDTIFAHNGQSDFVDGGSGHNTCHVDKKLDIVKNCAVVLFS